MHLSAAYLQQCQDWFEQGFQQGLQQREQRKQEGREEERKEMIENVFKIRFGVINPDLAAIIPQLLLLPTDELTRILLNASESELLHYGGFTHD